MKRGFTVWQLVLLLLVLGIIAVILFPLFARPREGCCERGPNCQSNLKMIGRACQQYLQDYDEKWPIARQGVTNLGWVDSLGPYIKSTQIFQCPLAADGSTTAPAVPCSTDYFMNLRLAGFLSRRMTDPAHTILLGDGENEMKPGLPYYAVSSIPAEWLRDTASPRYRHFEGSNFGFAEGHVKWYRAIGVGSPAVGALTFAPN